MRHAGCSHPRIASRIDGAQTAVWKNCERSYTHLAMMIVVRHQVFIRYVIRNVPFPLVLTDALLH